MGTFHLNISESMCQTKRDLNQLKCLATIIPKFGYENLEFDFFDEINSSKTQSFDENHEQIFGHLMKIKRFTFEKTFLEKQSSQSILDPTKFENQEDRFDKEILSYPSLFLTKSPKPIITGPTQTQKNYFGNSCKRKTRK